MKLNDFVSFIRFALNGSWGPTYMTLFSTNAPTFTLVALNTLLIDQQNLSMHYRDASHTTDIKLRHLLN